MATIKVFIVFFIAGFFSLSATSAPVDAEKVEITLYYESLCPDCRLFILKQLYPTFGKVSQIMNLTLVPYGNAMERRVGDKWHFECQHGPAECVGNIIETCAIALLKNISVYFPFIHCYEANIAESEYTNADPHTVATACAKELGIDYTPIDKCQGGSLGNELEHEMAMKTDALEPTHEYVPWVTLFGKHTDKIQKQAESNLLKLVCDSYKGTKPVECSGITQFLGRCYRNTDL